MCLYCSLRVVFYMHKMAQKTKRKYNTFVRLKPNHCSWTNAGRGSFVVILITRTQFCLKNKLFCSGANYLISTPKTYTIKSSNTILNRRKHQVKGDQRYFPHMLGHKLVITASQCSMHSFHLSFLQHLKFKNKRWAEYLGIYFYKFLLLKKDKMANRC